MVLIDAPARARRRLTAGLVVLMGRKEAAHSDLSRIEDEQRRFLREGNLNLLPPLRWSTYGDRYQILH